MCTMNIVAVQIKIFKKKKKKKKKAKRDWGGGGVLHMHLVSLWYHND